MDAVVGDNFAQKLLKFEKTKNNRLNHYSKTANMRCCKIINEKVPMLIRMMVEMEMGYIPFVYGEDVNPNMSDEEMGFINGSRKMGCQDRYERITRVAENIKDCKEIIIKNGPNN